MKFSTEEKFLRKKDKKLKKIIDENGPINFKSNNKNQFDSIVEIVISQFISNSAANTIFKNVRRNFNRTYLTENDFENLNIGEIKNLGLSTNKAKTIKNLSELYLNKTIGDLTILNNKSLNETLLSVFGIGPWSINMFEIFCIGRLDVFSSKDAGLRAAMNNLDMVSKESYWEEYDEYAKRWSPYKTIASLHLWKTVD